MMTGGISDWRKLWREELLFLFVQIPEYDKWFIVTEENHYSVICKCQEEVTNTVQGAYLCSISDAGEERDIYPKNKKIVGECLALFARNHVYGEDILSDAPVAKNICRVGNSITITFTNAGKVMHITGEELLECRFWTGERACFHCKDRKRKADTYSG